MDIAEVARMLLDVRQRRYEGIRGRPPAYMNKEWEDLPEDMKEDFLTDVKDVISALAFAGHTFTGGVKRHNVLRTAKKTMGRIKYGN